MTNKEIARSFQLLGGLMELHEENPFKIRSYQNAYIVLRKLEKPLGEMSDEEMAAIQGLGKAIQGKIRELLDRGEMAKLNEYLASTPSGIVDMLGIKGLGPKKIRIIWKEMGIESPGELLYACEENRLIEYKGFGLKTQEELKAKIRYWLESQKKLLFARAEEIVEKILGLLSPLIQNGARLEAVGEFRRCCQVVNSLEFLVEGRVDQKDLDQLEGISVTHWAEEKADCFYQEDLAFTVHFSSDQDFPIDLIRLTGPQRFWEEMQDQVKSLTGKSEDEKAIFSALKLPFVLPEFRDASDPVKLAEDSSDLVLISDDLIKGVLHNHSTYSDGLHSLEEISSYVRDQGYNYFGISDHSQTAFYAHGLEPERVQQQFTEIDELNEKLSPFRVFKGIESDILNDGSLDYDEDLLKQFDFIVASIHSNLRMDEEKATARLIRAIENPYTRILGHPTGRLLLARQGYPIHHKKIIDACAANKVVIELNANPLRLDIDHSWIPYCLDKNVMISINPDAHSKEAIHQMRYGVKVARKEGLPASMCLNCLGLQEFEQWILNR